jgi:hypothetical protein
MKTLKLSLPDAGFKPSLSQYIDYQDPVFSRWDIRVNDGCTKADAWFIIEDVIENDNQCVVPSDKIFFGSAETAQEVGYLYERPEMQFFQNQFSEFHTFHQSYLQNVKSNFPFLPWMINSNHGDSIWQENKRDVKYFSTMQSIPKIDGISIFCSMQDLTPTHKMRIRFALELKKILGPKLFWYGNGINSVAEKWDGIAPFKYSIVLENQSRYNVVTEKISDAFLGLSFPLYWGAPNISDVFDENGFEMINIENLPESVDKIEKALAENLFETRLEYLVKNRMIVLNEFNFLKRIITIIEKSNEFNSVSTQINLKSKNQCKASSVRVYETGRDAFSRIVIRLDNRLGTNLLGLFLKLYVYVRYNKFAKLFKKLFS